MPTSLEQDAAKLLTLPEAVVWIENHLEEMGLARAPRRDTLKRACQDGRLKAVLKGGMFLTRERELRIYLTHFDPKNKTESRPLKQRALKTRAKIAQGGEELTIVVEPTEIEEQE